jgi:hypothetical protein
MALMRSQKLLKYPVFRSKIGYFSIWSDHFQNQRYTELYKFYFILSDEIIFYPARDRDNVHRSISADSRIEP